MTKYHYTYYSYEEFGRGYIGKRSCNCKPEEDVKYFGSYTDKTFKPTQKIILETYDTAEEALADEVKLHKFYNVRDNPHFANRARQTSERFYYVMSSEEASESARKRDANMTSEQRSERTRKGMTTCKALGIGIISLTPEQLSTNGKKGGKKRAEQLIKEGFYSSEKQSIRGQKAVYMKKGIHGLTKKQRIKYNSIAGKKGGEKNKKNKSGICGLSKEQRSETTKKTNSQKWKCTETGYITNAGGLSTYQKARGIDTSNRIRIA